MKMNRFFAFATAVLLSATIASAQSATQSEQVCRIGMQYQISYNEHWGANKPVIITVDPGSAADAAGLKPGDVIEKVAGKSTASLDETDFQRLLTEGKTTQIEVSNLGGTRTITLGRDCQSRYILSERQLARSFSFYSLEDASERRIVRPYKVKTTKADFTNLRTYSFAASTAETAEIDDVVYKEVGRYLNALGMKETVTNPDVIVDTYYLFDNNKLFTTFKSSVPQSSWQYSPREKKMVSLPIMPAGTQEINAPYVIQLGVRLINAKNNLQIFWQCESNDFLSAPFSVQEYARYNVPLMMMEFPFIRYRENPTYRMRSQRYFYTGLYYQANDLSLVAAVDPNSPAAQAGLRTGDRIISINGVPALSGSDEYSTAYKEFIKNTMKYRTEQDIFTDANGLAGCRYWLPKNNKKIVRAMTQLKYKPTFAYLFFFRPYVNDQEITSCVFQIQRNGVAESIIVQPVLRDESFITLE